MALAGEHLMERGLARHDSEESASLQVPLSFPIPTRAIAADSPEFGWSSSIRSRRGSSLYKPKTSQNQFKLQTGQIRHSRRRKGERFRHHSMPDLRVPFDWVDDAVGAFAATGGGISAKGRRVQSFRTSLRKNRSQNLSRLASPHRVESPLAIQEDSTSGSISRYRSRRSVRGSTRGSGSPAVGRPDSGRGSIRLERTRSWSPIRELPSVNQPSEDYENRYQSILHRFERNIVDFRASLDDSNTDGSDTAAQLGLVREQLKLSVQEIIEWCGKQEMNSQFLSQTSELLVKLMEHCSPDDPAVTKIRTLLRYIATPLRFLECLEPGVEEEELTDDTAHDMLLDLIIGADTGDNKHMSNYISSRMVSNFGPEDADDQQQNFYKPQEGLLQQGKRFLQLGRLPTKHDFNFVKLLSAGAYGGVWLAVHRDTSERVAIKVLKKKDMMDKNVVRQVMAEKNILQFARSPFLINLWCSFTTKESLYMVMEYASGGDLAAYLKMCERLPVDQARRYIAETILAVEYIHEFGIVHRDLKPDNLVIAENGHIKLTDFGLSKVGVMNRTSVLEEHSVAGVADFKDKQRLGTPDYMAPEVITGQGYGKAVDWWAIGIILYEFLYGAPPYSGDTVEELWDQTLNAPVEFPEDDEDDEDEENRQDPYYVIPEARDLIELLLEKDPARRLGTPPPPSHLASWEQVMPGAYYVKEHVFFVVELMHEEGAIDWDNLLLETACFVPVLDDDFDTSYFDTRQDRYNHQLSSSSSDEESNDSSYQGDQFHNFNCIHPSSASATPGPGSSPIMSRSRRASRTINALLNDRHEGASIMSPRSPGDSIRYLPRPSSQQSTRPVPLEPDRRQASQSAPSSPPAVSRNNSSHDVFSFATPDTSPRLERKDSQPVSNLAHELKLRLTHPRPTVKVEDTASSQAPGATAGLASPLSSGTTSESNSRTASLHQVERRKESGFGTSSPSSLNVTVDEPSPSVIRICLPFDEQMKYGFTIRNTFMGARKHRVCRVAPGSAAEKKGIRPGFALLRVDHKDVTKLRQQQVGRMMQACWGRETVLDFEMPSKASRKSKSPRVRKSTSLTSSLRRSLRRRKSTRDLSKSPSVTESPNNSPAGSLHKSPVSSLRATRTASNLSTATLFDNVGPNNELEVGPEDGRASPSFGRTTSDYGRLPERRQSGGATRGSLRRILRRSRRGSSSPRSESPINGRHRESFSQPPELDRWPRRVEEENGFVSEHREATSPPQRPHFPRSARRSSLGAITVSSPLGLSPSSSPLSGSPTRSPNPVAMASGAMPEPMSPTVNSGGLHGSSAIPTAVPSNAGGVSSGGVGITSPLQKERRSGSSRQTSPLSSPSHTPPSTPRATKVHQHVSEHSSLRMAMSPRHLREGATSTTSQSTAASVALASTLSPTPRMGIHSPLLSANVPPRSPAEYSEPELEVASTRHLSLEHAQLQQHVSGQPQHRHSASSRLASTPAHESDGASPERPPASRGQRSWENVVLQLDALLSTPAETTSMGSGSPPTADGRGAADNGARSLPGSPRGRRGRDVGAPMGRVREGVATTAADLAEDHTLPLWTSSHGRGESRGDADADDADEALDSVETRRWQPSPPSVQLVAPRHTSAPPTPLPGHGHPSGRLSTGSLGSTSMAAQGTGGAGSSAAAMAVPLVRGESLETRPMSAEVVKDFHAQLRQLRRSRRRSSGQSARSPSPVYQRAVSGPLHGMNGGSGLAPVPSSTVRTLRRSGHAARALSDVDSDAATHQSSSNSLASSLADSLQQRRRRDRETVV